MEGEEAGEGTILTIPGVTPHQCVPPALNPNHVQRTRVIELLASASTPTVLVAAGAGFGKTTSVRQWTDIDGRPLAWLTLAPHDNDPVVFVRALVCCLASLMPMPEVVRSVREPNPRLVDRVLPLLEEAVSAAPAPFVLVLDDLESVQDGQTLAFLDQFLDGVRPGSTVLLVSRSVPDVHEAKRLVEGRLARISVDDLALTSDEAEAMLVAMAPDVESDIVEAVVSRTEGWPVGLQLAGMTLARTPDAASIRGVLSGDGRMLSRYFEQEVLLGIEPDDLEFLARSSVLDRMTGELCDHVLDQGGSVERLKRLVSAGNTLVLPLGDSGLYRYHSLFRELLLAHLRRSHPAEEGALRKRAVDWHLAHGEGREAVAQALTIGDPDLVAECIISELVPLIFRGEMATLESWLQELPDGSAHRSDLRLALSEAWLSLTSGHRKDFERWLELAESADDQSLPDTLGSQDVAIATLRMVSSLGGIKEMMENARTIRESGPRSSPFWAVAWVMEGISLHLTGLTPDIREALEAGEFHSRGLAVPHAVALAQLGFGECRAGDVKKGRRLVREAVEEVNDNALRDYSMMPVVYCALAYSEAQRGADADSEAAARHAGLLMEMVNGLVDPIHIQLRLMLAEAALLRADPLAAEAELALIGGRLANEPDATLLHGWHDDLRDQIAVRAEGRLIVDLTPAEQRVLEQMPTHRSLAEIGDHLYISRNTVKSHTLSVYRKLSVGGRSQAVEKAQELGLLNGLGPNG